MPVYLDHHKTIEMSPEMAKKMVADMKAGRKDQFGNKILNVFAGKSETWCLVEAPNFEAVAKGHEGYGLKLGKADVVEVKPLV